MHEVDAVDTSSPATPTRAWIVRLHEDLVGQPPDSTVLARWTTAARHGASHREIASGMLVSNAYCQTQIARLYRALLDRDADAAGLQAWTAQLASGVALQEVIAGFCDGFEYKANYPEDPAFVESLFERLLGRASDPGAKAIWLGALRHPSTLAMVRGFLSCPEYCAQRASEIHERMLGREPMPAELASSTIALMQGAPLQQIVLGFATSPGYIARLRDAAPVSAPSLPTDPDADVVAQVGRGNIRSALAQLMQRHGTAVYRYCCAAVGDSVLADDIHQQVFIEAYRDLPSFAGRSTIRTWLLGIARHRVLDAAKRRKRAQSRVGPPIAAELPDPAADPGDSLDDAQLLAALRVCIAELDEPIRAAVLMRYQQRLTYEEMAAVFDEKPGTLQARVVRALRRLRQLIEAQIET